jgi:hypothetical protein
MDQQQVKKDYELVEEYMKGFIDENYSGKKTYSNVRQNIRFWSGNISAFMYRLDPNPTSIMQQEQDNVINMIRLIDVVYMCNKDYLKNTFSNINLNDKQKKKSI